ncbi:hypothetical protein J1N35_001968 [Gossypium stocksii]|uniref:Uncharacterized protein n=1 Tax=Gossypium stocksii TaxID=47602 RepID=A0A9D4AK43_9ROSI|nr:hypothetical protein J1N35_001968 [Gossypium stocksii]
MKTPILLALENFEEFLKLPPDGESNEKGSYHLALYVRRSYASELNVCDRVLHLIITWILHPISKHAVLRSTSYWWIDCFHSNRHLDLAIILFNEKTKIIGKELSSNVTLPFGTYVSYIFTRLNIPTNVDPPMSVRLQLISFAALHRVGFKLNPLIENWVKDDQPNPQEVDDEDVEEEHEEIPPPELLSMPLLLLQLKNKLFQLTR